MYVNLSVQVYTRVCEQVMIEFMYEFLYEFIQVKNVELPILCKEALLLKSSKLDSLENTAGKTNVVQRHNPRLFVPYAFGRFRGGPGGDFAVSTLKRRFAACSVSSPLLTLPFRSVFICKMDSLLARI